MKKTLIIGVFFILMVKGYSNPKDSTSISRVKSLEVPVTCIAKPSKKDTITVSIPNTIFIQNKSDKSNTNDWSKDMPWIGAIIICLLTTIGNLFINKKSRESNASIALEQIKNTKIIASEQMEQLRKNSERDFNKTVLSGTIQLWVSDFRTIISELLSVIAIISQTEKMEEENNYKVLLLITKAELMLSNELNQAILRGKLEELKKACFQVLMQNISFEELEDIVNSIKTETLVVLEEESGKARNA
ncbi:hypothetical protein [Flavobacterium sp. ACN6]|uniref:hypothetical protein n=1 Tax=Flavobacterium sp. ACN6 TaxID=1920426 RepID=UPI000BB328B9|nr:hypothetical protein [Flavobacterium sp. ACN6]PBJ11519.1 hypothetical protein BSF42_29260 [Flavobacterium sp. ACN6]